MGSNCSKSTSKTVKNNKIEDNDIKNSVHHTEEALDNIFDPDDYDKLQIKKLKQNLNDDVETFILNQFLMSVMFFSDYEEDITRFAKTTPENDILIKQHQKELILPDAVLKSVCQRIEYQPQDGIKKNQILPFITQRMYILHNNIEIDEERWNLAGYTIIDKPFYQAKMEYSREHQGFVQVQMPTIDEARSSADSDHSEYSENLSNKIRNRSEIPSTSTGITHDSGFNTESDYDYTTIIAAKTPKKLNSIDTNIYTHIAQLPSKCFTLESKNSNNTYLNSYQFMLHFKDNVFPNYLGEVLKFPVSLIECATSIDGSIFCTKLDDSNKSINYEIMPCIGISWPSSANEWRTRARTTVRDHIKRIDYRWPTDKMCDETVKLKCVLMPRGFIEKRTKNPKKEIEWEIGFPKAERYLELRMSHAQTRIFVLLLILHRVFIEPKTGKVGLTIEHIRYLMFWQCEANYKDWPEDKLGTKLKIVLKKLSDYLGNGQLPHYFIRTKNVFENFPTTYRFRTLDELSKIMGSPLMHLIVALKNMKYSKPLKFYPQIDLDKLIKIITSKTGYDSSVEQTITSQDEIKKKKPKNDGDKKNVRSKDSERYRRQLEEERKKEAFKMSSRSIQTEESSDLLQLTESFEKARFKEIVHKINLLIFFIEQFIEIANRSLQISSTQQTSLYSKQASYLIKILEDVDMEKAKEFENQIAEIEKNCQQRRVTEPTIPNTPRRNTFNTSDTLQVKTTHINTANLSKTYNEHLYLKSGNKKKGKTTPIVEPKLKITSTRSDAHSEGDNQFEKPASPTVKQHITLSHSKPSDKNSDEDENTTL